MTTWTTVLDTPQRTAADAVLDREAQHRQHIVVALSGAHAYGFPSPDSDLDLKAIHIAPTRALLGLDTPVESAAFIEMHDGIEVDYTSNELGPVLRGILSGNGNYVERVLGALIPRSSAEHEGLREICRGALSRKVHHHYRGFAHNQHRSVVGDERPAAKGVLYVLRTALTGTHLLRSGELVVDVTELIDAYGHGEARELIEAKRAGETTRLDAAAKARWMSRLDRALGDLDDARETSCLPEHAPNQAAAQAWLVEARLARC